MAVWAKSPVHTEKISGQSREGNAISRKQQYNLLYDYVNHLCRFHCSV